MENRVSASQIDELLDFLESHPSLAKGSVGLGYWIDLKHRVKSRVAQYRQDVTGTGGGPANVESFSEIDRRIMALLGEAAIFGDTQHQVPFGDSIVQPLEVVEEQIENISEPCPSTSAVQPAPEMESKRETPSSASSPLSRRPTKKRRVSPRYRKRVSNDWVIELEEKRVEAEGKLGSAALVMAEASRIQAEASRMQAEASRMQAEVALMQMKVTQEMSSNISKLLEILKK